MMRAALALLLIIAASCGHYADFALPPPQGARSEVKLRWDVKPAQVIERGAPGEWDSVDTLNPSVVQFRRAYWNLYSGFDGKIWHTGVATSPDGLTWTRQGKILSPTAGTWEGNYIAANGAAVVADGIIYYWYQAGDPPQIGLLRSGDGRAWNRTAEPVLRTGPRGSWDERGVADPYVVRLNRVFYLFYLGQDRARRQRLGIARSLDGIEWTKLRTNPILELGGADAFDENGLGEPAIWTSHGRYWMLYTGRDRFENRRLGMAYSDDGVHWRRFSEKPVMAGDAPWDSKVVCDPSVEADKEGVRVWFGGGDVAHPAENIHGQIGYATLHLEAQ